MTREYREYAKSRIEYLLKICKLDERDKEALEAAIQALEKEGIYDDKEHYVTISKALYDKLNIDYEALSQEPCDDAISREDVIKLIQCSEYELQDRVDNDAMCDDVRKLSSVTQKSGKWIPVSERLPEDGTYLVTVARVVGNARIDIKSFAKDLNKVDEFDFPKHKCGWYDYDSEYGYWQDASVIAWMPLPKPYEPQERSDKE